MQILNTSGATQTLRFIPRLYISNVVVNVKNTQTNIIDSYSGSSTIVDGYQEYDDIFNLIESTFYTFEVLANDELIYRGQIFCTDQTDKENYNISKGDYITPLDINDEIIIF